jgi:hypothetical protein
VWRSRPSRTEGLATVAAIGLTRKEIHEARELRDAEARLQRRQLMHRLNVKNLPTRPRVRTYRTSSDRPGRTSDREHRRSQQDSRKHGYRRKSRINQTIIALHETHTLRVHTLTVTSYTRLRCCLVIFCKMGLSSSARNSRELGWGAPHWSRGKARHACHDGDISITYKTVRIDPARTAGICQPLIQCSRNLDHPS